jgi:hypothetical protein
MEHRLRDQAPEHAESRRRAPGLRVHLCALGRRAPQLDGVKMDVRASRASWRSVEISPVGALTLFTRRSS